VVTECVDDALERAVTHTMSRLAPETFEIINQSRFSAVRISSDDKSHVKRYVYRQDVVLHISM